MHRITRIVCAAAAFAATAGGTACRRTAANEAVQPQPATMLRVQNQAFLDMVVYVVSQSGGRLRLGTATGSSTTTLRIPSNLLFGTTSLRFIADPIGGAHASVSSTISVIPGDTVVMTIPPS